MDWNQGQRWSYSRPWKSCCPPARQPEYYPQHQPVFTNRSAGYVRPKGNVWRRPSNPLLQSQTQFRIDNRSQLETGASSNVLSHSQSSPTELFTRRRIARLPPPQETVTQREKVKSLFNATRASVASHLAKLQSLTEQSMPKVSNSSGLGADKARVSLPAIEKEPENVQSSMPNEYILKRKHKLVKMGKAPKDCVGPISAPVCQVQPIVQVDNNEARDPVHQNLRPSAVEAGPSSQISPVSSLAARAYHVRKKYKVIRANLNSLNRWKRVSSGNAVVQNKSPKTTRYEHESVVKSICTDKSYAPCHGTESSLDKRIPYLIKQKHKLVKSEINPAVTLSKSSQYSSSKWKDTQAPGPSVSKCQASCPSRSVHRTRSESQDPPSVIKSTDTGLSAGLLPQGSDLLSDANPNALLHASKLLLLKASKLLREKAGHNRQTPAVTKPAARKFNDSFTAGSKLPNQLVAGRRKQQHCTFFNRLGKCKRGNRCKFLHDPTRVAMCTRFLNGRCHSTGCTLSHRLSPGKLPTCSFFLRGVCNRDLCPYRHVNVGPDAPLCEEFARGYCSTGLECTKLHVVQCRNPTCTGEQCSLWHGHREKPANTAQKKPESRVPMDTSSILPSRTVQRDLDDPSLPLKYRRLPQFIPLGAVTREAGSRHTETSKDRRVVQLVSREPVASGSPPVAVRTQPRFASPRLKRKTFHTTNDFSESSIGSSGSARFGDSTGCATDDYVENDRPRNKRTRPGGEEEERFINDSVHCPDSLLLDSDTAGSGHSSDGDESLEAWLDGEDTDTSYEE